MANESDTVSLRITLRYRDLDEFVQRYADNVSSAGLFLRTKAPKPSGTRIRFELLLTNGTRALRGEGVVVGIRADDKPGMSLRFTTLDGESRSLIERLVSAHGQGALAPAPLDAGPSLARPSGSEFRSESGNESGNESGSEFRSESGSEFRSELGSEFRSESGSEFRNGLGSDFRRDLASEPRSEPAGEPGPDSSASRGEAPGRRGWRANRATSTWPPQRSARSSSSASRPAAASGTPRRRPGSVVADPANRRTTEGPQGLPRPDAPGLESPPAGGLGDGPRPEQGDELPPWRDFSSSDGARDRLEEFAHIGRPGSPDDPQAPAALSPAGLGDADPENLAAHDDLGTLPEKLPEQSDLAARLAAQLEAQRSLQFSPTEGRQGDDDEVETDQVGADELRPLVETNPARTEGADSASSDPVPTSPRWPPQERLNESASAHQNESRNDPLNYGSTKGSLPGVAPSAGTVGALGFKPGRVPGVAVSAQTARALGRASSAAESPAAPVAPPSAADDPSELAGSNVGPVPFDAVPSTVAESALADADPASSQPHEDSDRPDEFDAGARMPTVASGARGSELEPASAEARSRADDESGARGWMPADEASALPAPAPGAFPSDFGLDREASPDGKDPKDGNVEDTNAVDDSREAPLRFSAPASVGRWGGSPEAFPVRPYLSDPGWVDKSAVPSPEDFARTEDVPGSDPIAPSSDFARTEDVPDPGLPGDSPRAPSPKSRASQPASPAAFDVRDRSAYADGPPTGHPEPIAPHWSVLEPNSADGGDDGPISLLDPPTTPPSGGLVSSTSRATAAPEKDALQALTDALPPLTSDPGPEPIPAPTGDPDHPDTYLTAIMSGAPLEGLESSTTPDSSFPTPDLESSSEAPAAVSNAPAEIPAVGSQPDGDELASDDPFDVALGEALNEELFSSPTAFDGNLGDELFDDNPALAAEVDATDDDGDGDLIDDQDAPAGFSAFDEPDDDEPILRSTRPLPDAQPPFETAGLVKLWPEEADPEVAEADFGPPEDADATLTSSQTSAGRSEWTPPLADLPDPTASAEASESADLHEEFARLGAALAPDPEPDLPPLPDSQSAFEESLRDIDPDPTRPILGSASALTGLAASSERVRPSAAEPEPPPMAAPISFVSTEGGRNPLTAPFEDSAETVPQAGDLSDETPVFNEPTPLLPHEPESVSQIELERIGLGPAVSDPLDITVPEHSSSSSNDAAFPRTEPMQPLEPADPDPMVWTEGPPPSGPPRLPGRSIEAVGGSESPAAALPTWTADIASVDLLEDEPVWPTRDPDAMAPISESNPAAGMPPVPDDDEPAPSERATAEDSSTRGRVFGSTGESGPPPLPSSRRPAAAGPVLNAPAVPASSPGRPIDGEGNTIVALDIGGRWTKMGIHDAGEVAIVPADGHAFTSSIVALRRDGGIAVGSEAQLIAIEDPDRAVSLRDVLHALDDAGRPIHGAPASIHFVDGEIALALGNSLVPLSEALFHFLSLIKRAIVQHLASDAFQVIISVPHDMMIDGRRRLELACEAAGLPVARLVSEPEVLIHAYSLDEHPIETALLVDLGATHLMLAIVRRLHGALTVVEHRWYDRPCGHSLDETIAQMTLEELARQVDRDYRGDPSIYRQLMDASERARGDIRRAPTVDLRVMLPPVSGGSPSEHTIRLGRIQVYQRVDPQVAQFVDYVREIIATAELDPRELGAVVCAGSGGTFPPVVEALTAMTMQEPMTTVPPTQAYITGGARIALAMARHERATHPGTLQAAVGIELLGGRFRALAPTGSGIPLRLHRSYPTTRDNQTDIELKFYQGDGDLVRSNTFLGALGLRGFPKGLRAELTIELDFHIDRDGVLTVSLYEPTSNARNTMRVPTRQTPDERREELEQEGLAAPGKTQSSAKKKGFFSRLFSRD